MAETVLTELDSAELPAQENPAQFPVVISPAKKILGRPRKPISKTARATILRELRLGKSLASILKAKGMPSMSKIQTELGSDESFRSDYAQARKVGVEYHIDQILELADSATQHNALAVRLRVDTRKWLAAKVYPKLYGDRIGLEAEVTHRNVDANDPSVLLEGARRIAFILAGVK